MKRFWSFSLCLWLCLPILARAAQTAQATLFSRSVRFYQSTDESDFFSLNLSTLTTQNNGELGPYFYFFSPTTTHAAYLNLVDELFGDHYGGAMDLSVPSGGDANGNGFADFFEVAQGISANSSGSYSIPGIGSGSATASWSRSAGSRTGTCALTFHNSSFGNLVFIAVFDVLEYTGQLTYTPGSNTVSGTMELTQTGDSSITLQAPLEFIKVSTNRFNKLTLQASAWTNASLQTLNSFQSVCTRDVIWPTNYFGNLTFDDGDPNTGAADYYAWVLSIDDMNDADHDGIPDLSDDPFISLARRPVLTLARGATNCWLTIAGDINHLHEIQESTNLVSTNWVTVMSFTLTNDPQTVSLPLPTAGSKFLRVRAQ
jgi:hypothetical protein